MFEEPKLTTEAMKMGLARMYGDTFMREYLANAVAISKNNALTLLGLGKTEDARDYLSRAKCLQQLLDKGKEYFVNSEKSKKVVDPLKFLEVKEVKL